MITVTFSNRATQVIKPTVDFYLSKEKGYLTDGEILHKVKDLTHDLPNSHSIHKTSVLYRGRVLEMTRENNNPQNFVKDVVKEKQIKVAERNLIKSLKKEIVNPKFTIIMKLTNGEFIATSIKN